MLNAGLYLDLALIFLLFLFSLLILFFLHFALMANYHKSLCKNTAVSKGKAAVMNKQIFSGLDAGWIKFLIPPPDIQQDKTHVYLLDLATRSNSSFFLIA